MDRFCIKGEYTARLVPEYFVDSLPESRGITHQPDVYPFANYLATMFGCSTVIDVGCGRAQKLMNLSGSFSLVGIDYGSNIGFCRSNYSAGQWVEFDLEEDSVIPLDPETISKSIVICSDVIEHLVDPTNLLKNLKRMMEYAPVGIITTPERDLVRGLNDPGPPGNPAHVREWNLSELHTLLAQSGFRIGFAGLTFNNDRDLQKRTSAIILKNSRTPDVSPSPENFSVVAIMTAFNEEDIIASSIGRLVDQGIGVYLIDNWSTDSTYSIASRFLGRGLIGTERFPVHGPSPYYEWKKLLQRVEQLSCTLEADWFIHHDVDEVRESPWDNVSLKDGLYHVDRSGYNAIDHTCVVFHPTDDGFDGTEDYERYFQSYEFGKRPGHFSQVKAWKRFPGGVSLAASGGHEVNFEDRRIFPFKFLLKHYPIRSQRHGVKKILLERKPRWDPGERADGWHSHYDAVDDHYNFIRSPEELERFDRAGFPRQFLFERLSGVGIVRPDKP